MYAFVEYSDKLQEFCDFFSSKDTLMLWFYNMNFNMYYKIDQSSSILRAYRNKMLGKYPILWMVSGAYTFLFEDSTRL